MNNVDTILMAWEQEDYVGVRIEGQGVRGADLGTNLKNKIDSGYRDDVLSEIHRPIGVVTDSDTVTAPSNGGSSVRNFDGDLRSVCNLCFRTIIFAEGKAETSNNKNFGFTSMVAARADYTCYSMLVVYPRKPSEVSTEQYKAQGGYDKDLSSLTICINGKTVAYDEEDVPVKTFQALVENLVMLHQQSSDCKRGNRDKWEPTVRSSIWCKSPKCSKKTKECTDFSHKN